MASLGAVLEQYPNDVIIYITDPRTGVQRHCKWPPSISEIVAACDARIAEIDRNERYRNWGKIEPLLLDAPRENRPTLEELKAKYGDNWGLPKEGAPRKSAPSPPWDEIVRAYSEQPSRLAGLLNAKEAAK